LEDEDHLSFWNEDQIQNRIGIKNPGIRTVFELELNLFEVQTCLGKSGKFPKIPICLPFPEYEFRLT
jgi:hypothetical protein